MKTTQERRDAFAEALTAAMRTGAAQCNVDAVFALFQAEGPAAVAEKERSSVVSTEQLKERVRVATDVLRYTDKDAGDVRKVAMAVVTEFLGGVKDKVAGDTPGNIQVVTPDKARAKR